jgi:hypothetical protein
MTPKEKAAELVVNYQLKCKSLDYDEAKQCALICVDQVIEQNNFWINQTGKGTNNYWKLVKEEINKL